MKKAIGLLALICGVTLFGGCDSEADIAVYHASESEDEQLEAPTSEEEEETAQSESVPPQAPATPNDAAGAGDDAQALNLDPVQEQTPETVTEAAPITEETPVAELTPEETADIQTDAPLGIPVLSDWEKTYDSAEDANPMGDGVTFTITWNGIDGADGYETEFTSQQSDAGSGPYVETKTVAEPIYEISFSHIYMYMKIKVRAYKETEAGRQYGDWSLEKEMSYSPV